MASSNLNRVRYSGLDFATHEDELLARLQVKFGTAYNDFAVSSLGIMLIDLFCYGLDTLSWYLDRRATDLFLSTARTRKSVARTARQLGYKMSPAVASSVDLTIAPSRAYDFPVMLPVGFKFSGPGNLVFQALSSYTWAANDTAATTITCAEGETLQLIFASDGTANQVFNIRNVPSGKFIVGPGSDAVSQTMVEVNGEVWSENDLLIFGETNQYEVGYNDDPPTLRFGDSIAGNIPPQGAEIRFTYFASTGLGGKASVGTITSPVAPLVVNFTAIDLTINNASGSGGGSDPETLEKAKASAPRVFKSRGVNITAEDYEARAGSFTDSVYGAVAAARALSVRGASSDVFLQSKLREIEDIVAAYPSNVETGLTSLEVNVDTIDSALVDARVADLAASAALGAVTTKALAVSGYANDAATSTGIIEVSTSSEESLLAAVKDIIFAIDAGGGSLSAGDRTTCLSNLLDAIALNTRAHTEAGVVRSLLSSITIDNGTIATQAATASARRVEERAYIDAIDTQNAAMGVAIETTRTNVSLLSDNVGDATSAITAHVDAFLSSDCQSNLIEVPILVYDSEGFYALPTNGLVRALQDYLDAKKEVTQVVRVTAASNVLVAANITAHVGVLPGYVEGTVRAQVEAEILQVLRGRRFGDALELSELYWPVSPDTGKIAGIDSVNIKIVGPEDHLQDNTGNLIVSDSEVVTRGTVTLTSEMVPTSG